MCSAFALKEPDTQVELPSSRDPPLSISSSKHIVGTYSQVPCCSIHSATVARWDPEYLPATNLFLLLFGKPTIRHKLTTRLHIDFSPPATRFQPPKFLHESCPGPYTPQPGTFSSCYPPIRGILRSDLSHPRVDRLWNSPPDSLDEGQVPRVGSQNRRTRSAERHDPASYIFGKPKVQGHRRKKRQPCV